MAALFQSFRGSGMAKRLLQYALARLDLLDADALNLDNLDLALGRNTVFEFRDVGIKRKKLQKLLSLPSSLAVEKAKVLLLRTTIPIDFYTSPIIVEVEGVDVRLKVLGDTCKLAQASSTPSHDATLLVPDTAELAQSFLKTESISERRRLESALAAETNNLGASATISDDGSEDDSQFGTGQTLSLPSFLTRFLQGVVDRTQVKINHVVFQLHLEVPAELNSSRSEPVSVQITLGKIEVEGLTSDANTGRDGLPAMNHQQGKRHLSLSNIRACLVSEADAFAALTRSPSTASPSLASSPAMTRSPPSRQATFLSQGSFHEQPVAAAQESFRERLSDDVESNGLDCPLTDSEDALAIPYDMSDVESPLAHDPEHDVDEDGPSTPRASTYLDTHDLPPPASPSRSSVTEVVAPLSPTQSKSSSQLVEMGTSSENDNLAHAERYRDTCAPELSLSVSHKSETACTPATQPGSISTSVDDLTQSHLYTHEEAESMYMSAFSHTSEPSNYPIPEEPTHAEVSGQVEETEELDQYHDTTSSRLFENAPVADKSPQLAHEELAEGRPPRVELNQADEVSPEEAGPQTPVIPGTWDESADDGLMSNAVSAGNSGQRASSPAGRAESGLDTESTSSSPAFSRASLSQLKDGNAPDTAENIGDDGITTPKGPPKLVKEILKLDHISMYIQSEHPHVPIQVDSPQSPTEMSQTLGQSSIYPQAPGAFSIHSSPSPRYPPQPSDRNSSETTSSAQLELELSPIIISFDASIAFLLAMVVERLLKAVKCDKPFAANKPSSPMASRGSRSASAPRISVAVKEMSINFLNRLSGLISSTPCRQDFPPFTDFEEVLLNMTLSNLKISSTPLADDAKMPMAASGAVLPRQGDVLTKIDLEKFRFGYGVGDILSFDCARQMSASMKNSFISTGHDVVIEILQSDDAIRTNVETLPLVVQIDLQRLDETFGWFGGLSSFLNMSASMTSSPCLPIGKPMQSPSPPKPRGVRFDTPIDPQDKSARSQNKINLRVGGSLIEIVGKDCSVAAETSALKLVSRDEGIGIGCSRLRILGPYLRNSLAKPAITAEVGGLRLEFFMAPKDADLEKLLELIIPSKVKFDHEDDEVMVDTLLRQRRKGSVLRATLDTVNVSIENMAQLSALPTLGEEIGKLSTVAKYLPEDDRPGLLTLARVRKVSMSCELPENIGHIGCEIRDIEVGQITVPSLVAVAVHGIHVHRNEAEELVSSSLFEGAADSPSKGPVVMVRMIGDEIEPMVKLKLQDLRFEYRVATMMDFLDLGADATPQDFEAGLAASVANLGDQAHSVLARHGPAKADEKRHSSSKPTILNIGLRDCLIGLNPYKLPSRLAVALTDAHVEAVLPHDSRTKVSVGINKASILLTDHVRQIPDEGAGGRSGVPRARSSSSDSRQVEELCARGFVDICYMSSASVVACFIPVPDGETRVEVEVRDDLLVLETCADSTQTLIALANALKPPTPPSRENKYRTKVLPVQDLLASISAEAFGRPEGEYDFDQDFAGAQEMAAGSGSEDEFGSERMLSVDSRFFGSRPAGEELLDATKSVAVSQEAVMEDTSEGVLLTGFSRWHSELAESTGDLVVHDNFYDQNTPEDHAALVWNSTANSYDRAPSKLVKQSPLKVSVRDVHVIWNLFDGYDWAKTRDTITKAVEDVQLRATERQARRTGGVQVCEDDIEDEETIGDFLFNSIYIGIPSNRDPQGLTRAVNEGVHDHATETESVATTTVTMNTNRTAWRSKGKSRRRLRLNRSRHHKMTFEMKGVNVDLVLFPPGTGETVSSIDARVEHFDIFDHISTSTWKKFATYDQDHGEREMGTSMMHVELLHVKPVPQLAASEMVLRATVLPLRLHVDQDALDFIARFFEFKDDAARAHASPSDIPFLQRAEVMDIPVKLDFKPKRVDYGGLRSGHTTEFMNFIVLEESRMVLRHVIIYGVAGFDRLGKTLNDIWMPDVRTNQLPGVVAGLAPVRSLVNIGSGFRDLVEIPLREYQKDGRIIRSISKGAAAFVRTTGTELVKFGAKLAVGTQYALQGAEDLLSEREQQGEGGWDAEDGSEGEDRKQISLYADQPTGVLQGIRGGLRSLARDVNLARDAIIAVPGEVMSTQSAVGAAKAVLNRAPTILFRPAVGVTKAVGQTLMGATNALDQENRRRIGEKYKR